MVIIKWNTHFMICLVLVGRRGRTAIIKWKCVFLNFMFLLAGVGQNASLSGTGEKTIFHVSEKLAKHGRPHREGTELDGLWHTVP